MCSKLILPAVVFLLAVTGPAFGQEKENRKTPSAATSSPAFAEVLLRRSVLEVELEDLLVRYKEEFPRVALLRFEISRLDSAIERILAVGPEESGKLTLALGKMLVQKAKYETELYALEKRYNDKHPEVVRARRRLEIFRNAVERIL